jgi:hypothetical protein
MTDTAKKNIHQLLAEVAIEIPYVKKASDTGVGGKGVARDEVVAKLRKAFLDRGVLVSTSQVAPGTTLLMEKDVLYSGLYATSFINVNDPADRHVVQHEGHGKDRSDKAPGKASTYAEKLNIIKALCLETGIADEQRYPEDRDEDEEPTTIKRLPVGALDQYLTELQAAKSTEAVQTISKAARKQIAELAGDYKGHPDWVTILDAATKRNGELSEKKG